MFLAPFLLAITTLLLITGTRLLSIHRRAKRLIDLELRPNCLLTRSPIVFVTGRRSLLYFLNYWNEIPGFLREHGYDTRVCTLPWRGFDSRFKLLSHFIESSSAPVHLIADTTSRAEVEKLLLTHRRGISSVQFAEEITGQHKLQRAIGLKSDHEWSIETKYLDHVISLAENEHS